MQGRLANGMWRTQRDRRIGGEAGDSAIFDFEFLYNCKLFTHVDICAKDFNVTRGKARI